MTKYAYLALVAAFCSAGLAQDTDTDRLTVPFSDPARPKMLKVSLMNGSIQVTGYDGKDVIVEGGTRSSADRKAPDGMRRIPMRGSGLEAEEENNVIRISANSMGQNVNLTIQVPRQTSLQLKSVNGSRLSVDGVQGDIEANATNGKVSLTNVSGTVIAHSLNGGINATLNQVRADKPMSFSTMNGNIDVTLPADIKARMKFKADHGDVFTDFDVKMEAAPKATTEESRSDGKGKYRISVDRAVYGTVNGGGADMSFTTVNGRIYVRKKP